MQLHRFPHRAYLLSLALLPYLLSRTQVFNQFASKQEQEQGQARGMHKNKDEKGLRKAGHHVEEHAIPDRTDSAAKLRSSSASVLNPLAPEQTNGSALQAYGASTEAVVI